MKIGSKSPSSLSPVLPLITLYSCHVSAITVSPSHRRLSLATNLMKLLQTVAIHSDNYFVDLFVRESNLSAIKLYQALGYMIWRRVKAYYGGNSGEADEDAFGESLRSIVLTIDDFSRR